jgi:hypothetical protein
MCWKKWPYYLFLTKLSLILNGFIGNHYITCDSVSIFMLMYDSSPNPFDFSFKAIILGTTLHSHLSLWQTETNKIQFNILTAMSSVYQDCKSLSVFYALFGPLVCAVIGYRLDNQGIGMRDFSLLHSVRTSFSAQLSGVLVGIGGCLSGVKAAWTWKWVLTTILSRKLTETGTVPSPSHTSLMSWCSVQYMTKWPFVL